MGAAQQRRREATKTHPLRPDDVPRADDSERAVVGDLWLGRPDSRDLALHADPADFFLPLERDLMAQAKELAERSEAIDGSKFFATLEPEERGTHLRELAAVEQAGLLVRSEQSALDHLARVRQAARYRRLLQSVERLPAILNNGFDPEARAAALAGIVTLCAPPQSTEVFKVLDVATLIKNGVPEPQFDLAEFLVRGTLTYLTGPPKGRKTLLALAWSAALAKGRPFCGLEVQGDHRVLFVEAEFPMQIPVQFAKVCGGAGLKAEEVLERVRFLVPEKPLRLEDPAHAQALLTAAQEFRATWVVIDSFVRVHGLDENSSGDMARLANTALLPLRDQAGCGVLVLDHPPKPFGGVSRGKKEQLRGTWEKLAAADCQIYVEGIDTEEGKVSALSVPAARLVPERDEPLYLHLNVTAGGGLEFKETEEPEAPPRGGRPPTQLQKASNVIANETSRKRDLTFAEAMQLCINAGIGRSTAAKAWAEMKPESNIQEVQQ